MTYAHVIWDDLPWQAGDHPLEHKKLSPDRSCSLLMFMPGFVDPNWCARSHALHIVSGTLSVEVADRRVSVGAGELLLLAPGTRHRASNDGSEPVVILALSDLALSLQSASS